MTTQSTPSNAVLMAGTIVLTLATAAVHLYLGSLGFPMFILNGLGYLGLLAALYLSVPQLAPYRGTTRWALIGYTTVSVVLWVAIGERTAIGYTDKVIEVSLITLLLIEARRPQGSVSSQHPSG